MNIGKTVQMQSHSFSPLNGTALSSLWEKPVLLKNRNAEAQLRAVLMADCRSSAVSVWFFQGMALSLIQPSAGFLKTLPVG